MKEIGFVKLANKWFAILPEWEGDVEDLQMVCGADMMLDAISKGSSVVTLKVSEVPVNPIGYTLTIDGYDEEGAGYMVEGPDFSGSVWLCAVTKYVFGYYPRTLYVTLK